MMEKKKEVWKILLIIGGFISYNVGAGFASGNEILQFYACWDKKGVILSLICGCLLTIWFCAVIFWLGQISAKMEINNIFQWATGKIPGKIFRLITDIMIIGCFMLMFSGAGNVLQQQFKIPLLSGAVILGIATVTVVLGGHKKIETVLGYAGIIILTYAAIFALYTLIGGKSSIENMALIPEAVSQGQILRANILALFPFSIFPRLASFNSPVLEGILYSTQCIMAGFPFYFSLGRRCTSEKQAVCAGVLSGIAFYLCITFVVVILIFNFDALINPETGSMFVFPALAALNKLWTSGGWTYSLVIFTGIFSSAVGYLWVMNERVFPQEEGTKRSKILIASLTLTGVLVGNKIPFSELINFLFPMTGAVGFIMLLLCTWKLIQILREKSISK